MCVCRYTSAREDLCVVLMDYVCIVILGDGRPTSRSWHIGKTLKFLKV